VETGSPKLPNRLRHALRLKHYAYSTEQSYVQWIKRYILFHDKRHPEDLGRAEIEAFFTHLAIQERVAASTQNQALSVLLFLYQDILELPSDFPIDSVRAQKPERLPTVLTRDEAPPVINGLSGTQRFVPGCSMVPGCGS
jgi:integrase